MQQKREQRPDIDDADPQKRRQQKQEGEELRPREEDVGDPVEDPAFSVGYNRIFGCRRLAHAPSSMVTMADFGQISRTLSPGLKLVSVAGTSAVIRTSPEATLKRVTAP